MQENVLTWRAFDVHPDMYWVWFTCPKVFLGYRYVTLMFRFLLETVLVKQLRPMHKTRLIRLRAVDGYASDITRYSIDPSYNPHSYSPLVLQPTFDLWLWADLAQNLISSSTPGGAPLYQVWWKSTQGFLRFCVNEVKIAYLDQVHWPLTFGESRPKSNQFIYSWRCIHVPSLMKIHPGVLEISRLKRGKNNILRPSSLTFDVGRITPKI